MPAVEIAAGWYWFLLAGVFSLSLASHIGLHLYGLYSISADESERALMAHDLTLAKAIEPLIWPPFPKILTGLALSLYDDLFITPRILVAFVGLLTLGALVVLSRQLFANRLIGLVAGMLGVFIPQRLILSVVPLSDVFAYLFALVAAGFLIGWLRSGRARALTCASVCLLLAATVRYEAWFFNVVLAFYLAYRALVRRDLGFEVFVLNGALLAAFPCAWVVHAYLHDGSLAVFSLASDRFVKGHGYDVALALKNNVIVVFMRDVALGPAFLIGMLALLYFAVCDLHIRAWALLLFSPLAILGAIMGITFGVPMAAPFRTDGVWILLLVPFAAWAIVWLAQRMARATAARYLAVALMAYICIVPFVLRSHTMAQEARTRDGVMNASNRTLGKYLRALLQADDRRILLDAIANLDYLNVIVAANAPERFILNVDADPVRVGIYATQREYYLKNNETRIVETYLTDKFAIEGGIDLLALRAHNIGYVLVRNRSFIEALDANPQVARKESFGPWVLFGLRES